MVERSPTSIPARGHLLSQKKGRSAAYCSQKHPTYTIVKLSTYLSFFFFFYSHQILYFHQFKVKRGKEESFGIRSLLNLKLSRFSMWGGVPREWRFSDKGIVPL
uniref:Uncharacterized protein n=1 Tax=Brassica oleracea TaxID=3712 RepID=A0A3P6G836_BRAOL|nr:unnamed protein product [Brassica oleracea]